MTTQSNNPNSIRIILVNTTHPGNIGATARAMKNMGLSQLYLVNPQHFPHPEATARASGADDILENAKVVEDLSAAVTGCTTVVGTSARTRALPWPTLPIRECAEKLVAQAQSCNVAVVFGQERMGLTNDELKFCNYLIYIPSHPEFSSLNIASAVQIIAYEIWQAALSEKMPTIVEAEYASADELAHFYRHLQQILIEIDFIQTPKIESMMQRLHRLFNRAKLEKNELNILRGILTAIHKKIPKAR